MYIAGGMEAKFVPSNPIRRGARAENRRLTNWAVMGEGLRRQLSHPAKEDWSRPGRWEDLEPAAEAFSVCPMWM